MLRTQARSRGFTLVEIAVVLVIVALISALGFGMVSSILQKSNSLTTRTNADAIRQGLARYLATYSRFPCPALENVATSAANAGIEDANPGCTATAVGATQMARGVVPWKALGLPVEQAQDGYGRMFRYHVSVAATTTTSANVVAVQGNMTLHSGTPAALGLPPTGNQINSCMNTASPPAGGDDLNGCNLRAVVVLISYGSNGLGAPMPSGLLMPAPTSAPELANTDNDVAFVNSETSANAAAEFDDLVYAWAPGDFLDSLAQLGAMKSSLAITNDQLKAVQSAIVNVIVNDVSASPLHRIQNSLAAYGLSGGTPTDIWGGTIVYLPATSPTAASGKNVCDAAIANQSAFTLTSIGRDGVQGLNATTNRNDDITLDINTETIKTIINARGLACP